MRARSWFALSFLMFFALTCSSIVHAAGISTSRSNIRTKNGILSPTTGTDGVTVVATGGTGLLVDFDQTGDGVPDPIPGSFLNATITSPLQQTPTISASQRSFRSGNFNSGPLTMRGIDGNTNKVSIAAGPSVSVTSSMGTKLGAVDNSASADWSQSSNFTTGQFELNGSSSAQSGFDTSINARSSGMIYDPMFITVDGSHNDVSAHFTVDLTDILLHIDPGAASPTAHAGVFAQGAFGLGGTFGQNAIDTFDYSLLLDHAGEMTVASASVYDHTFALSAGQTYWFGFTSGQFVSTTPEPAGAMSIMMLVGGLLARKRHRGEHA